MAADKYGINDDSDVLFGVPQQAALTVPRPSAVSAKEQMELAAQARQQALSNEASDIFNAMLSNPQWQQGTWQRKQEMLDTWQKTKWPMFVLERLGGDQMAGNQLRSLIVGPLQETINQEKEVASPSIPGAALDLGLSVGSGTARLVDAGSSAAARGWGFAAEKVADAVEAIFPGARNKDDIVGQALSFLAESPERVEQNIRNDIAGSRGLSDTLGTLRETQRNQKQRMAELQEEGNIAALAALGSVGDQAGIIPKLSAGLNLFGEQVPNIAAIAGATALGGPAAGAATAGGLGLAYDTTEMAERINALPDAELVRTPEFRRLVAENPNLSLLEARNLMIQEALPGTALRGAAIGTASGLIGPEAYLGRAIAGRVPASLSRALPTSVAGRAALGGVYGGLEEGLEEAAQEANVSAGYSRGTGEPIDYSGVWDAASMGALFGIPLGGLGGAFTRPNQAQPQAEPGAVTTEAAVAPSPLGLPAPNTYPAARVEAELYAVLSRYLPSDEARAYAAGAIGRSNLDTFTEGQMQQIVAQAEAIARNFAAANPAEPIFAGTGRRELPAPTRQPAPSSPEFWAGFQTWAEQNFGPDVWAITDPVTRQRIMDSFIDYQSNLQAARSFDNETTQAQGIPPTNVAEGIARADRAAEAEALFGQQPTVDQTVRTQPTIDQTIRLQPTVDQTIRQQPTAEQILPDTEVDQTLFRSPTQDQTVQSQPTQDQTAYDIDRAARAEQAYQESLFNRAEAAEQAYQDSITATMGRRAEQAELEYQNLMEQRAARGEKVARAAGARAVQNRIQSAERAEQAYQNYLRNQAEQAETSYRRMKDTAAQRFERAARAEERRAWLEARNRAAVAEEAFRQTKESSAEVAEEAYRQAAIQAAQEAEAAYQQAESLASPPAEPTPGAAQVETTPAEVTPDEQLRRSSSREAEGTPGPSDTTAVPVETPAQDLDQSTVTPGAQEATGLDETNAGAGVGGAGVSSTGAAQISPESDQPAPGSGGGAVSRPSAQPTTNLSATRRSGQRSPIGTPGGQSDNAPAGASPAESRTWGGVVSDLFERFQSSLEDSWYRFTQEAFGDEALRASLDLGYLNVTPIEAFDRALTNKADPWRQSLEFDSEAQVIMDNADSMLEGVERTYDGRPEQDQTGSVAEPGINGGTEESTGAPDNVDSPIDPDLSVPDPRDGTADTPFSVVSEGVDSLSENARNVLEDSWMNFQNDEVVYTEDLDADIEEALAYPDESDWYQSLDDDSNAKQILDDLRSQIAELNPSEDAAPMQTRQAEIVAEARTEQVAPETVRQEDSYAFLLGLLSDNPPTSAQLDAAGLAQSTNVQSAEKTRRISKKIRDEWDGPVTGLGRPTGFMAEALDGLMREVREGARPAAVMDAENDFFNSSTPNKRTRDAQAIMDRLMDPLFDGTIDQNPGHNGIDYVVNSTLHQRTIYPERPQTVRDRFRMMLEAVRPTQKALADSESDAITRMIRRLADAAGVDTSVFANTLEVLPWDSNINEAVIQEGIADGMTRAEASAMADRISGVTVHGDNGGPTRIYTKANSGVLTNSHEFQHYFLESALNIINNTNLPQTGALSDLRSNIVELGRLVGLNENEALDYNEWQRQDLNTPQDYTASERAARLFEAYIATGKVPNASSKLERLFSLLAQTFRNLRSFYRNMAIVQGQDISLGDDPQFQRRLRADAARVFDWQLNRSADMADTAADLSMYGAEASPIDLADESVRMEYRQEGDDITELGNEINSLLTSFPESAADTYIPPAGPAPTSSRIANALHAELMAERRAAAADTTITPRFSPSRFNPAREISKWSSFATTLAETFVNKSARFEEWVINSLPVADGDPLNHPVIKAFRLMRPAIKAAQERMYRNLAKPFDDFSISLAQRMGWQPPVVFDELGRYAWMRHVVNEGEAAFRQNLEQEIRNAEALPQKTELQRERRSSAILQAQARLDKYIDYQDNGNFTVDKKGKKIIPPVPGGMRVADIDVEIQKLLDKGYTRADLDAGADILVRAFEGLTQERLRAGTLTMAQVERWMPFTQYVPLSTAVQVNAAGVDHVDGRIFNPGRADYARNGSKTPAASASDTFHKMLSRTAAEIGGQQFKSQFAQMYRTMLGPDGQGDTRGLTMVKTSDIERGMRSTNFRIANKYRQLNDAQGFIYREQIPSRSGGTRTESYKITFGFSQDEDVNATNAALRASMSGPAKVSKFLEPYVSGLTNATYLMSRTVTKYRAYFAPLNAVKDYFERVANITGHELRDAQGNLINGTTVARKMMSLDGLNEIRKAYTRGLMNKSGDGKWDMYWREFEGSGINFTFTQSLDFLRAKPGNHLKQLTGIRKKLGIADSVATVWNDTFNGIPAFLQYVAMRELGVTNGDAAAKVLQLMDFFQTGNITPYAQAFFPFFKSVMQGGSNMLRTLGVSPNARLRNAKRAWATAGGLMLGFSMLLPTIQEMAGDDDETGVNRMDELTFPELSRGIPIWSEDGATYTKFPIGFGLPQLMWTSTVAFDRTSRGLMSPQEAGYQIMAAFGRVVAPETNPDYPIYENPPAWFAQTFAPYILRPFADLAVNRTNFGSPIYQDNLPVGVRDFEGGRSRTPEVWKEQAKAIYDAVGLDVAPETVRHFANYYTPGPLSAIIAGLEQNDLAKDPIYKSSRDTLGSWLTAMGAGALTAASPNVAERAYYRRKEDLERKLTKAGVRTTDSANVGDSDAKEAFVAQGMLAAGFSQGQINQYMTIIQTDRKLDKLNRDFKKKADSIRAMEDSAELLRSEYQAWWRDRGTLQSMAVRQLEGS